MIMLAMVWVINFIIISLGVANHVFVAVSSAYETYVCMYACMYQLTPPLMLESVRKKGCLTGDVRASHEKSCYWWSHVAACPVHILNVHLLLVAKEIYVFAKYPGNVNFIKYRMSSFLLVLLKICTFERYSHRFGCSIFTPSVIQLIGGL